MDAWRRFPYDMTSLLGQSWKFYEAQRSGNLPADNKLNWRDDSFVNDGSQVRVSGHIAACF